MPQVGLSNRFTVSILEDGESAQDSIKRTYAYSAYYEKTGSSKYPAYDDGGDIKTTDWVEIVPTQPVNKPALWHRDEIYEWDSNTRTYVLNNSRTVYVCETAKPTVMEIKGVVIYVRDDSSFPTSPTPETGSLAIVVTNSYLYVYSGSWQQSGTSASIGDVYVVNNENATYRDKSIDGHGFRWDGSKWDDVGEISRQGPPGEDACSAYISNNTITFNTNHSGRVAGATSATLINVSYLKGSTMLAPNSISINGYTVGGETQIEQNLFASIANSSPSITTLSLYCKSIYSTVELDLSKGMKNYPVTLSYTGNPDVSTTLYVKGDIPTIVSTDYYYYVTDASSGTATDSKTGLALRSVPLSAWSRDAELPTEKYNYIWRKTVVTYSNGETVYSMVRYWRQVTLTPVIKMGTAISGGTINDATYISGYNFNLKPNNKLQSNQGSRNFFVELWSNGTLCRINRIAVDIIYPDGKPAFVSRQLGAYLGCSAFFNGNTEVYRGTLKLPFYVNGAELHYDGGVLDLQSSEICNRIEFNVTPQADLWMQAFKASGETAWSNPMNDLVYRITLAGTTSTAASSTTALDVVWQADLSLSGSCKLEATKYKYTCSDTTSEDIIRTLQEAVWQSNKEVVPLGNNYKYLWQRTELVYKGNYSEYSYSLIDTYDVSNLYTKTVSIVNDALSTVYTQENIELNPKGLVLNDGTITFGACASVKDELPIITKVNIILDHGDNYTHKPTFSAVIGRMVVVSTPAGIPSMQNWYELKDGRRFIKTYDASVVDGKNYYLLAWQPDEYTPQYNSETGKYSLLSVSEAWQTVALKITVNWDKDDFISSVKIYTDEEHYNIVDEMDLKVEIEINARDNGSAQDQYTTSGTFTLQGVETSKYNSIILSPFFRNTPAESIPKGELHGLFPGTTAPMIWDGLGGFTTQCGYTWLTSFLPDPTQPSSLGYKDLAIDAVEYISDGSGSRYEMHKYILVLDIQKKVTYFVKRYKMTLASSLEEF